MNFGRMETATGPGAECAHVTVFWPMKSCRHMSPGDRSENNTKSYFHCTVIIITSYIYTESVRVRLANVISSITAIIFTLENRYIVDSYNAPLRNFWLFYSPANKIDSAFSSVKSEWSNGSSIFELDRLSVSFVQHDMFCFVFDLLQI